MDRVPGVLEWGLLAWPISDALVARAYGADSNGAFGPMVGMTAESELTALLGNRIVTLAAGRERPYVRGCARDPSYAL